MTKFKISAEAVSYLETVIEAKNESEAWEILEDMLDNGELPEVGMGSIENKNVEEIKQNDNSL